VFGAARAIFLHTGHAFDEAAPVFGLGRKNGVDFALRHNRIRFGADAGIEKQVGDIAQAALGFVDGVFAVAVAKDAPRHLHFLEVERQAFVVVVKNSDTSAMPICVRAALPLKITSVGAWPRNAL
jgi:hypothetical protein